MELPAPQCPQLRSCPCSRQALTQSHTFPRSLLATLSPVLPQPGIYTTGGSWFSPEVSSPPPSLGLESGVRVPLATQFQLQNFNLPTLNKKAYFFEAVLSGIYVAPSSPTCCHNLQPPSFWSLEPIHRGLRREQAVKLGPTILLGDIEVHVVSPSTTWCLFPADALLHSWRICPLELQCLCNRELRTLHSDHHSPDFHPRPQLLFPLLTSPGSRPLILHLCNCLHILRFLTSAVPLLHYSSIAPASIPPSNLSITAHLGCWVLQPETTTWPRWLKPC